MTTVKQHLDAAQAALALEASRSSVSVDALLRRERGCAVNVEHVVDSRMLGSSGYDFRDHLNAVAGQQIGQHVAKKVDFLVDVTYEHKVPGMVVWLRDLQSRFRATVYAYTESELRALIQKAYSAGAAGR